MGHGALHPDNFAPLSLDRAPTRCRELIGSSFKRRLALTLHSRTGLAFGAGVDWPDLAGGDWTFCSAGEGLLYVDGGDAEFVQAFRIQPDPGHYEKRRSPKIGKKKVADAGLAAL